MALTYTPAGALGSLCPDFQLSSVDGKLYTRASFAHAPALFVMFICNHCPYVRAIEPRLLALVREFPQVASVGICANDPADHPEDQPPQLLARWRSQAYGFPYLLDTEQSVAREFAAVCTPDLYLYDGQQKLRYRGRLDDSWRDPARVTKQELRLALLQILSGQLPDTEQNPAMGCSIKWKIP